MFGLLLLGGIDAEVVAELETGVDRLVVAGVDGHLHPVAAHHHFVGVAAGLLPVLAGFVGAGAAPDAVILQATVNAVAVGVVIGGDVVKLAHGRAVTLDPVFAAVVGDIDAAVVAEDEMAAVFGVDPERVVIGVGVVALDGGPGFAAVGTGDDGYTQRVKASGVTGFGLDTAEVVAVRVVDIVEVVFMGAPPGGLLLLTSSAYTSNPLTGVSKSRLLASSRYSTSWRGVISPLSSFWRTVSGFRSRGKLFSFR